MRALVIYFLLGLLVGLPSCSGAGTGGLAPPLSNLQVSLGTLSPAFAPETTLYTLSGPGWMGAVQVTPTTSDPATSVLINGTQAASGSSSAPIAIGAGVTMISLTVQLPGATSRSYDIAVMRSPESYLKASNPRAYSTFGAVSLSGDTLAVAASSESSSATGINGNQADTSAFDSGAVYVFVRTGTTWSQQAYLKASNTDAGDQFGESVSLSGDTLAVAANVEASSATGINGNQADNRAPQSGAVYVFVRSGTTWSQQAYLKASNTDAGDLFGVSIALSGDTLAVGATNESSNARGINGNQADNSASQSGAVYVFVRSGTTWSQQAYVKSSNSEPGDGFGSQVSLSGDTLAVGAVFESSSATGINGDQADNSASQSGAVYVFVRAGSVWTQQAYVKASNTLANERFGWRTSLSGDTLAVGAYEESSRATGINGNQSDHSAPQTGAVYIFVRTGTAWTQQAYVKASNAEELDGFGIAVSLSGDILAVGADGESSGATGINGNQADNTAGVSGAVYVFTRTGTTWTQQSYVKASNTDSRDRFGLSLSLAGSTLAVGAFYEASNAKGVNGNQTDNSAFGSGAVYVF